MSEWVEAAKTTLKTLAIYEVNGWLFVLYVLWEHVITLATVGAFAGLVWRAPREQAPWLLVVGVLVALASAFAAPPVPFILLAMTTAGLAATWWDRFNPETLAWRVAGGLALYALAALAYEGYSAYLDGVDAMTWAQTLGARDEAASTLAQGRAFVNTLATWGLWLIIPLGYFSLLGQALLAHPPSARPDEVITAVRTRGYER